LIFQVCIATFQTLSQSSTNIKVLNFLGEPNISLQTKEISKLEFSNFNFIRPYGTTNHPNFLAGLVLLGIVIIQQSKSRITNTILTIGLIQTFSISAIFSNLIWRSVKKYNKTFYIILGLLTAILLFKLVSTNYTGLENRVFEYQKVLNLNFNLIEILIGNNFGLPEISNYKIMPWENTPYHNHILHIIQYYGLVGLGIAIFSLKRHAKKLYFLLPIIILDHYFLTLPNGILLLSLFIILQPNDLKEVRISSDKIST
jgi:hypothetical protein